MDYLAYRNLPKTTLVSIPILFILAGCGAGESSLAESNQPGTPDSGPSPEPSPEPTNNTPVANAGVNQNITTGTIVSLNASNSNDADGDSLTYNWMFVSRPTGSGAVLNNSTIVNPSFTADLDGNYTLSLTVNDGILNSPVDFVVITSSTVNSAPVAVAGPDQNVMTGSTVSLDGSGSSDADNDALTYAWTLVSKPASSGAVLNNATIVNPSFTADMDGSYTLNLVINDGTVNSAADSIVVTSTTANSVPIANAGPDQSVSTSTLVSLDGSNSSDANNDMLTYSWSFVSKPTGSGAVLNNSTIVNPSFTADLDGSYTLGLVVNDGTVDSASDNVLISSTTQSGNMDDFAGNGSLLGYTVNNPNSLPDVTRTNGRYRANLVDNTGNITLHYNARQGRLDAKQVTFPFEAIARNIGIGTQTNSQTAPTPTNSQYIFAGLQVHVLDFNSINSSHVVVGHRGGTHFTVEGKNTRNGASVVNDAGLGSAPLGRADIRIVGNADRSLTVYWQQPNLSGAPDNWQLYRGTGVLPGTAPTFGASVYVGLITYAQDQGGLPFVGTCDSFEIID